MTDNPERPRAESTPPSESPEPRKWTLRGDEIMPRHISGSGYGPPEPITSVDGPRLAVREKVEVVEASALTASEERLRERERQWAESSAQLDRIKGEERVREAESRADRFDDEAERLGVVKEEYRRRAEEAEEVLREIEKTPTGCLAEHSQLARSYLSGEQGENE